MATFSYLYTNDVRIATLQEKITWVANAYVTDKVPNSSVDKSASNNFATIAYYFGLTKDSNLTKAAVKGNADIVILNFIKKFQFPNPRTSDSLKNEVACGEKFAPLREIVKVLVQFYTLGLESYLTLEEIRLFLFYNAAIAKRENYNLIELCHQIVKYRTEGTLPNTITVPNPNDEFWKHETRQVRELIGVLKKVNCIKEIENGYCLDAKALTYQLKGLLFDIVTYDNFWDGSDKEGYAEYLDISDEELVFLNSKQFRLQRVPSIESHNKFSNYVTAIRTKPFVLLAGISGTGKSRIVRELARACWPQNDERRKAQKPENYEIVQVKPNWHDSSELIGYVSRITGKPQYVPGKFIEFVAKAWANPEIPYFLCLDEMNLAPVEQYFAEYLSVIETRKKTEVGIVTDPLLSKSEDEWYGDLVRAISPTEEVQRRFLTEGITIPQNLIVMGTVNMDETTFTFSRKVLDRAMTIEMNEVNLNGGLDRSKEEQLLLEPNLLIGDAAEGYDVYPENKEVCDKVIAYLEEINGVLENTPFKIAYRARNEFLMYAVNRLLLSGCDDSDAVLSSAMDEMTSMKILSRIEGDEQKIQTSLFANLREVVKEHIKIEDGAEKDSPSLSKINEMEKKLRDTGFTSFWS